MKTAWTLPETTRFLRLTAMRTADELAVLLCRTKAAVQSKRRQMKRLRELGVVGVARLARLLTVPENFAQRQSLAAIERHAGRRVEYVRRFVRRARGVAPHLVGPYTRPKQGT